MNTINQDTINQAALKTSWYKKTFEARNISFYPQAFSVQLTMQLFPWSIQESFLITHSKSEKTWLWNIDEMHRARSTFLQKTHEDPLFLNKFTASFFDAWNIYTTEEGMFYVDYNSLSIAEKINRLTALIKTEMQAAAIAYANDIFLTAGDTDWLVQIIEQDISNSSDNFDALVADLTTPTDHSFITKEHIDLLQVASRINQPNYEDLLKKHARRWHWIENSYYESLPLEIDFFEAKIQEMIQETDNILEKIKELEELPEKKRKRKEELFAQYNLSKKTVDSILLSEKISHITDLRKSGVMRLNACIWMVLRDIAKYHNLSFEPLTLLMPDELALLAKTSPKKLLKKPRNTEGISHFHDGEHVFISGADFLELDLKPLLPDYTNTAMVTGQIAFKGKVSGTAKVIHGKQEFGSFSEGDILITNQTTPEFLPLIKKASGIITEQGGITCHAAIISREFKVPCIIGTQNACSVFCSGDEITLDASKGTAHKKTIA